MRIRKILTVGVVMMAMLMAETACGQAEGGRQTAGLQRPGFTWTLWYFLFVLLSITSGSSSYYYQLLPVLLPITINYFRFFFPLLSITSGSSGGSSGFF